MYASGAIVAFFMTFFMLFFNERSRARRLEQGESAISGFFDSLVAAAISAILSWLMVVICIILFFAKKQ